MSLGAPQARHAPRLGLVLAVLVLWWSGPAGTRTAAAQQTGPQAGQPDQVRLVRLTAEAQDAAQPPSADGAIHFDAVVSYQLQTAETGFLLLFIFENDAETSSQHSAGKQPVGHGSGQVALSTVYRPHPGVQALTLLIGLFKPPQTLLAWASTTPVSLAPFPGRAAFTDAMAARLAGDHAQAVDRLSTAIEFAPENGNYYYWRADSRIQLGQYDGAIGDYTHALELMPQDRASLVGRGVALMWKEAWQPAIADLTRVIEADAAPDRWTSWALRGRGVAEAALSRPAEAIADYRRYLAATPSAPDRAEVEGWIRELSSVANASG